MTNTPDDEQMAAISEALASGKKILAIKIYRESTGRSLREAKDFIEALAPKLAESGPENHVEAVQTKGGCVGLFLSAVVILYGAAKVFSG